MDNDFAVSLFGPKVDLSEPIVLVEEAPRVTRVAQKCPRHLNFQEPVSEIGVSIYERSTDSESSDCSEPSESYDSEQGVYLCSREKDAMATSDDDMCDEIASASSDDSSDEFIIQLNRPRSNWSQRRILESESEESDFMSISDSEYTDIISDNISISLSSTDFEIVQLSQKYLDLNNTEEFECRCLAIREENRNLTRLGATAIISSDLGCKKSAPAIGEALGLSGSSISNILKKYFVPKSDGLNPIERNQEAIGCLEDTIKALTSSSQVINTTTILAHVAKEKKCKVTYQEVSKALNMVGFDCFSVIMRSRGIPSGPDAKILGGRSRQLLILDILISKNILELPGCNRRECMSAVALALGCEPSVYSIQKALEFRSKSSVASLFYSYFGAS